MSDPSNQSEPTMEEILASIRKIISEDDAETETPAGGEPAASEAKQAPEDVLELTERIEDEPAGADEAEIDAILASVTGAEGLQSAGIDAAAEGPEGIVSSETERAVTSALSQFAGALIEQNKDQDGPIGGNQSLDALVRSALEPYLKSWLDEHLEALVERVLKEELNRMARRAENL